MSISKSIKNDLLYSFTQSSPPSSKKILSRHFSAIFETVHSVSLGIDHPLENHNPVTISVPQGTENLPRKTKSPDNSNMLYVFHNDTYTDFRTANKRILIPSYVIRVI